MYWVKRILFCALAAAILTFVASSIIFEKELAGGVMADITMTLTATGERSSESWGNEIRIRSITIDGEDKNLAALADTADGWIADGDLLAAYNITSPVSVTIPGLGSAENFEILMIGQMGSGLLEVTINDYSETVDLYRNSEWEEVKWTFKNDGNAKSTNIFPQICILFASAFIGLFWLSILSRIGKRGALISLICILTAAAWLALEFFAIHADEPGLINSLRATLFSESMPYWFVMISMALWLPALSRKKGGIRIPFADVPVRVIIWAALFMMGMEFMSCSGSVFVLENGALILGFLLHISILLFFYGVTGSMFAASCIASAALLLLNAANYYTLKFRGTALHPSDLNAIGTAMEVVGGYRFNFERDMLVAALYAFAACAVMWPTTGRKKRPVVLRIILRVVAIACGIAMVVAVNVPCVRSRFGIDENLWKIKDQYIAEGFTLTFADSFGSMLVTRPEGYSSERTEQLYAEYASPAAQTENKPNVIAVMIESFSDLEALGGLETTEETLPVFNSLKGRENTLYGSLQVSVLGGLTSKTELEFLSGINGRDYSSGAPFSTIINRDINALPAVMGELGYKCVAYHPESGRNWSRDKGYPRLGFDDFIARGRLTYKDKLRGFISDSSFYNEVIAIDEAADEPVFIFGITMQNHGGYLEEDFDEPLQIVSPEGDFPMATQYLNLIKESDRALGEFISHYETVDEPTVILFFGDHLPFLDNGFFDALIEDNYQGDDRDKLLLYTTPFLIWANYDLDKEQLPADGTFMSVSLLQSVLMEAAGLPMTGWQQYLSDLAETYPVISLGCVLDSEGNCADAAQIDMLRDYHFLQYDLLKGKGGMFTYAE